MSSTSNENPGYKAREVELTYRTRIPDGKSEDDAILQACDELLTRLTAAKIKKERLSAYFHKALIVDRPDFCGQFMNCQQCGGQYWETTPDEPHACCRTCAGQGL